MHYPARLDGEDAMDGSTGMDALIDPGAGLTCLGSGYEFTEGPVWVAAEQAL
jgi:hypothetical protein